MPPHDKPPSEFIFLRSSLGAPFPLKLMQNPRRAPHVKSEICPRVFSADSAPPRGDVRTQLDISPEEGALLLEILTTYRATVCAGIHRTEDSPDKPDLKEKEELLNRILSRLCEPQGARSRPLDTERMLGAALPRSHAFLVVNANSHNFTCLFSVGYKISTVFLTQTDTTRQRLQELLCFVRTRTGRVTNTLWKSSTTLQKQAALNFTF